MGKKEKQKGRDNKERKEKEEGSDWIVHVV